MNALTHVSLFSGVGGIDTAMHQAGIPTISACEIDNAARGVLADRFPDTHLYTDVREVTGDGLRKLGLHPDRTVVSAGFPCQDLSVAGRRRGMGAGTRSGLYWEVDRILGEFAPRWVVLENVPGLLSATCACPGDGTCVDRALAVRCDGDTHPVPGGLCWGECIARHGGVMGAVLGSLADRGYGFAYRVLDAQHFGVPQRRRRVVVVGRLGDDGSAPARVLLEPEGLLGDPAQGITPRPLFAPAAGRRAGAGRVTRALTTRSSVAHAEGAAGGHLVAFQKVIRSGARDADGNLPPEVWAERDVAATLNLNDLGSRPTWTHRPPSHPARVRAVAGFPRRAHRDIEQPTTGRLAPVQADGQRRRRPRVRMGRPTDRRSGHRDPRGGVRMTAPALLPDVDLLDLLADLDAIRCTCGCDAAFDLAAYEARAAATGVRVFPLSTPTELAERYAYLGVAA